MDLSSTGHHLFSLKCCDTTQLISYRRKNKNMYIIFATDWVLSISSMPGLVSSPYLYACHSYLELHAVSKEIARNEGYG